MLATTEALLKSFEDILTRNRSHPSSIEIRNAILTLDFPLFAKILTVQAHGKGFDELFPLGIAQLQSCLKNLSGVRHREHIARRQRAVAVRSAGRQRHALALTRNAY